jgi:hypothetical protein
MFKVRFSHDLFNDNPELRKRIKGLHVEIGYNCSNGCYCDCGSKCKHRSNYRWHNFWVNVSLFLRRKFNIDWHNPIYITKHYVDLSGTSKCPFKKERMYHCIHCKHHAGYDEYMKGLCSNKEWRNASYTEAQHPTNPQICKFFEKNNWADNYDKETGEMIY